MSILYCNTVKVTTKERSIVW